eukprot:2703206-Alexandrium_andersonii.AAC.1
MAWLKAVGVQMTAATDMERRCATAQVADDIRQLYANKFVDHGVNLLKLRTALDYVVRDPLSKDALVLEELGKAKATVEELRKDQRAFTALLRISEGKGKK